MNKHEHMAFDILRRIVESDALSSDEFADERCVFCGESRDMPPTYRWEGNKQVQIPVPPFEHGPDCIIIEARALLQEVGG